MNFCIWNYCFYIYELVLSLEIKGKQSWKLNQAKPIAWNLKNMKETHAALTLEISLLIICTTYMLSNSIKTWFKPFSQAISDQGKCPKA